MHAFTCIPMTLYQNSTALLLAILSPQGIPLLRFAAWNRVSSNQGSSQLAPRDWAARTTPDSVSQVGGCADWSLLSS